jgi:hypothetical protein
MKLEFSRQIYSNIKFYEIPSSGSRVVACGRTDGQTDMTVLTVAFRSFAKALKTSIWYTKILLHPSAIKVSYNVGSRCVVCLVVTIISERLLLPYFHGKLNAKVLVTASTLEYAGS